MEIDELPENDERLLKKPEIKRDEMGRFEQHGAGLIKKAQRKPRAQHLVEHKYKPGHGQPGPGRPKGSLNKTTKALKDMILGALDRVRVSVSPKIFFHGGCRTVGCVDGKVQELFGPAQTPLESQSPTASMTFQRKRPTDILSCRQQI
jgi:hypothetical protein